MLTCSTGDMWRWSVLLLLSVAAAQRAALVDRSKLPLHTKGRYIVNVNNERVKWACINWAGAYSRPAVVGGLEVQDLSKLAGRIRELGFNCVRLCYSTENHLSNPLVNDEDVAANPDLKGKRFLYIFQRTVQALTNEGLMVILNNHISKSGWCCNVKQDEGFWYTDLYPEKFWLESLVGMTTLFRNNSLVVAFDIRNEPHDIPGRQMTWGTDDAADWKAAAERAGNAILDVNPNLLIVVSALCFCMDLRPVKQYPIQFSVANRLVYETHNYIEFQVATLASNNFFSWAKVHENTAWILGTLVILDLACMWTWYRMGQPWPRKSTLLALVSGWASFFMAVLAGVCFFGYYFYTMYCSYVAKNYFLPWGIALSAGCLLLLLLGAWAACIGLRIQTSENCGVVPEVCEDVCIGDSCDEDEKSLSSDFSDFAVDYPGVRKDRIPGFAREPGFASLSLAKEYCLGRKRHLPPPSPPHWDCGMLLFLQIFMFLSVCTLLASVLLVFSHLADTFWYVRFVFDTKWGFALAEGFPYTAPVWMGEFGQQVRGSYWLNMLRYLAERDIDFAYWPLNGKKYSEGYFSSSGGFVYWDQPRWEDESFGLLMNDSWSVRHTWKLLDIQALMDSPVKWTPQDYPCIRQQLGSACGY
ncbi:unnamed protein product [Symbiodinium natans]|uniref:Glycoside hydrolase family 5 domain-containing protein n=1 Tax=Symbiodinium natans TaxID=878477 RepID=A0A812NQ67_9DINO|nr:unnamed protein product [Symbiodinium natans]